ncbi:NADP-dependent phosphogluconate dehydrogenase [Nonlabens xiamenensis]|uniref:NADP-dependent phosphogluconate dehydrogenase n=1 Tax=Nonlabens xiamenensis TaxID=2341043 RepID=UPI000F60CD62|nr:NADP-dependent phosphogluconate dehydrogenase [Nonlabens xiamenensis]
MNSKSFIGIYGLGVMGKNLASNLAGKNYPISVYNRSAKGEEDLVKQFAAQHKDKDQVLAFDQINDFIDSLDFPRKILLMVPSSVVEEVIDSLTPLMEKDDILIDGGNSHYQQTERLGSKLAAQGIKFLGMGVSGGARGALTGPSLMPGGDLGSYQLVEKMLADIAATDTQGKPCVTYIGSGGAGHFVKTLHNGIEYGEMQLLAEVHHLLNQSMSHQEIADLLDQWNKTDLNSYLLGATAKILRKKEGEHHLIDFIEDQASSKGTGVWSSTMAMEAGEPATIMTAAVFARHTSFLKSERLYLSVNNPSRPEGFRNVKIDLFALEQAYRMVRWLNHHQGFELIRKKSEQQGWNIHLGQLSRIWTNGCIIKSKLMASCVDLLATQDNLFRDQKILNLLFESRTSLADVVIKSVKSQVPIPAFSTALQYWDAMTEKRSSASIIQAQRDFFGAHTYRRTDDDPLRTHHTNWDTND